MRNRFFSVVICMGFVCVAQLFEYPGQAKASNGPDVDTVRDLIEHLPGKPSDTDVIAAYNVTLKVMTKSRAYMDECRYAGAAVVVTNQSHDAASEIDRLAHKHGMNDPMFRGNNPVIVVGQTRYDLPTAENGAYLMAVWGAAINQSIRSSVPRSAWDSARRALERATTAKADAARKLAEPKVMSGICSPSDECYLALLGDEQCFSLVGVRLTPARWTIGR